MVELRSMTVDDVSLLVRWDDDPDVATALGGRGADWCDWRVELVRDVPWRELLIVEEDGRPIGFLQLTDALEEEAHYWGDIEPGTWALDIWIGSPEDRGRGLGAEAMSAALRRAFVEHGADVVVIDPAVGNRRAIAFYERLGFERVGVREFGDGECLGDAPAAELGRLTRRSSASLRSALDVWYSPTSHQVRSFQMSLPAIDRHRWHLDEGGPVDVIDLGFGVLTAPRGTARTLLGDLVTREQHAEFVKSLDDDDLATT